jgi:mannose-6-phosphate isomerase-like protein (cupin superfamily)
MTALALPLMEIQAQAIPRPEPFQVFSDEKLEASRKNLNAAPGNDNLFKGAAGLALTMTVEEKKTAAEFEWHEGRDHIFQVLEGSTVYELGGTPKNGRNVKPGEWLAPSADGASRVELKKGDVLVIPRGTLHKRTTTGKVTFYLISSEGIVR